jgi:hypothetical protein
LSAQVARCGGAGIALKAVAMGMARCGGAGIALKAVVEWEKRRGRAGIALNEPLRVTSSRRTGRLVSTRHRGIRTARGWRGWRGWQPRIVPGGAMAPRGTSPDECVLKDVGLASVIEASPRSLQQSRAFALSRSVEGSSRHPSGSSAFNPRHPRSHPWPRCLP